MKRSKRTRLLALVLTLAMLLGTFCISGYATDDFREIFPEIDFSRRPDWAEMQVSIQSGENTLRGYLTAPKDIEGQIPVAILLHGLGTDYRWCDDIAWTLADNGIASVRFDFNGTGMSDGAQEDMTISSEVQDTIAMLDYVQGLKFTDLDNIFFIGKSMGAVDATLAAYERQDEVKAMVLWYPGFSVVDATRHGFLLGEFFAPWDPPETLTAGWYTYGRDFIVGAQEVDYRPACEAFDEPVLILHGTHDFITPLFFSFETEKLFPDCELKVIPGGSHGFWGPQEFEALGYMMDFLEEQIG